MITDPTNKMVREIIRIYQDRVLGIAFLVLVPAAILLGLPTDSIVHLLTGGIPYHKLIMQQIVPL